MVECVYKYLYKVRLKMNKYMKITKDLADDNLITNVGGPFGAIALLIFENYTPKVVWLNQLNKLYIILIIKSIEKSIKCIDFL